MSDEKNVTFISILDRAFTILDYLYELGSAAGVSQIAKATAIPKANAFRVLKTLETLDVIQERDEGYVLGKKLVKYGNGAKKESDLLPIALPYMKELCRQTNETVNLGILYENSILIIHSEYGEQTTLVSRLIPISPLHCSSIGKLFLARQTTQDTKAYFQQELKKRTIHTRTDYDGFFNECKGILESSIAYDHEEYEYGLTCLSTPIVDANQCILGGISISGPTTRLAHTGFDNLEELLKKTGNSISEELSEYHE